MMECNQCELKEECKAMNWSVTYQPDDSIKKGKEATAFESEGDKKEYQ